jgi:hypothetical protein
MADNLEENPKVILTLKYILSKIIAASFSTVIFFIIWLVISGFDLIDTLKFFKEQHIIIIIFLYGMSCSVTIDCLT